MFCNQAQGLPPEGKATLDPGMAALLFVGLASCDKEQTARGKVPFPFIPSEQKQT